MKGIQKRKEEDKLSIFVHDVILYIRDHQNTIENFYKQ